MGNLSGFFYWTPSFPWDSRITSPHGGGYNGGPGTSLTIIQIHLVTIIQILPVLHSGVVAPMPRDCLSVALRGLSFVVDEVVQPQPAI